MDNDSDDDDDNGDDAEAHPLAADVLIELICNACAVLAYEFAIKLHMHILWKEGPLPPMGRHQPALQ